MYFILFIFAIISPTSCDRCLCPLVGQPSCLNRRLSLNVSSSDQQACRHCLHSTDNVGDGEADCAYGIDESPDAKTIINGLNWQHNRIMREGEWKCNGTFEAVDCTAGQGAQRLATIDEFYYRLIPPFLPTIIYSVHK